MAALTPFDLQVASLHGAMVKPVQLQKVRSWFQATAWGWPPNSTSGDRTMAKRTSAQKFLATLNRNRNLDSGRQFCSRYHNVPSLIVRVLPIRADRTRRGIVTWPKS